MALTFLAFFEDEATSRSLERATSEEGTERMISMWQGWPW
jgi:hypothetical protein